MELPLVGKIRRPLPWLLGLMAGSILLISTTTYLIVQNPNDKAKIDKLTVPVQKQNLTAQIKASGRVEPVQNVNISPKNPGTLIDLLVEQGDPVKKGQMLAVMDNRELFAQGASAQAKFKETVASFNSEKTKIASEIDRARARLVQAGATLEQARQRIPKQVDQAADKLTSAQSRLKLAQERIARYEYLLKEGAVTKDRYDEALNEYRNAQAGFSEAQKRLEELKSTGNPELGQQQAAFAEAKMALQEKENSQKAELARLQAVAESAEAEVKRIEIQYKDTYIRAPFDGVVTQKYASEGAFVTPTTSASSDAGATSSSIVAIARGLEIVAKVPEIDMGQLRLGQQVKIVADAYPDQTFQGVVKRIAPEAIVEQDVTSFEITVALVTGQNKLLSKMNVDVIFLGEEINNALVVPTVAIVTEKGDTGVLIPDPDNKPKFIPVTIGQSFQDQTQILEGIKDGQKVFIDIPEDYRKKKEKEAAEK